MSPAAFQIITRMGMVAILGMVTVVFGMAGATVIATVIAATILPVWAFALGNALRNCKRMGV